MGGRWDGDGNGNNSADAAAAAAAISSAAAPADNTKRNAPSGRRKPNIQTNHPQDASERTMCHKDIMHAVRLPVCFSLGGTSNKGCGCAQSLCAYCNIYETYIQLFRARAPRTSTTIEQFRSHDSYVCVAYTFTVGFHVPHLCGSLRTSSCLPFARNARGVIAVWSRPASSGGENARICMMLRRDACCCH